MARRVAGDRFKIRSRDGIERSHDAALSVAITRATRPDAQPGVWTIIEYEDEIARVTRHDDENNTVTVERL